VSRLLVVFLQVRIDVKNGIAIVRLDQKDSKVRCEVLWQ
jgi:hypothetical protein